MRVTAPPGAGLRCFTRLTRGGAADTVWRAVVGTNNNPPPRFSAGAKETRGETMSWGEAFGHAAGMWAMLFLMGIVFAIPAAIGYTLVTGGNSGGFVLILASALAFHVCSLAIVVKGVADATAGRATVRKIRARERRNQPDYRPARGSAPHHAARSRGASAVRRQESNHTPDGKVAASVQFNPNAATKISIEPAPPLRFSVSRNGFIELGIDCGEGVSWTVSRIGGNVHLAIDNGSGVGSGIAQIRCDPDDIYTLTVPKIAVVRIVFGNGDKIGRIVDCAVWR